MKNIKKVISLLLVVVLCFGLLAGCGDKETSTSTKTEGSNDVIVTVNGEEVTREVFENWYKSIICMSQGLDATQEWSEETKTTIEEYKLSYLQYFCELKALAQKAKEEGFDTENEQIVADLDSYINTLIENVGSEEDYETYLEQMAFTKDSFRAFLADQVVLEDWEAKVTEDITSTDDPEAYFNEHKINYSVSSEQRTVRHILVEEAAEAQIIINELDNGADFNTLVQEKSIDTGSVPDNGKIGPFDSSANLVQPFLVASFNLEKVGDYTKEPVQSDYGYHIIILDDITPAVESTYEDVKDQVKLDMDNNAKESYFTEYTNEVLDKATFEYADGWDPMEFYGAE